MTAVDPGTGQTVPLFHPRREAWDEHFVLETATGLIAGRTPTGRATVERLGVNAWQALTARVLWIALRWHP